MVNLRAIANRYTQTVNPNLTVQLRAYQAYAINGAGKSVVAYAAAVPLVAQVQALTKKEVEHLDSMNLSPCDRAAYVNGQLQAFDRVEQTGGDMLFFEDRWWKVMAVLEGWTGPAVGWCKVALVGQIEGPA